MGGFEECDGFGNVGGVHADGDLGGVERGDGGCGCARGEVVVSICADGAEGESDWERGEQEL